MSNWGEGFWGGDAWGGDDSSAIHVSETTMAIRENTIRVVFTRDMYFSNLKDVGDASRADYFTINVDAESRDDEGVIPRAVSVIAVERGLLPNEVDVILDRPMAAFPAIYRMSVNGVKDSDLSTIVTNEAFDLYALRRMSVAPTYTSATPSRDVKGPVGFLAAEASPGMTIDGTGDYANDQGDANLKKRCARRSVTVPGKFAHLSTYGLGLLTRLKTLARPHELAQLSAEAERQYSEEPDVTRASVRIRKDPSLPLFRMSVKLQTGANRVVRFEFAFPVAS